MTQVLGSGPCRAGVVGACVPPHGLVGCGIELAYTVADRESQIMIGCVEAFVCLRSDGAVTLTPARDVRLKGNR